MKTKRKKKKCKHKELCLQCEIDSNKALMSEATKIYKRLLKTLRNKMKVRQSIKVGTNLYVCAEHSDTAFIKADICISTDPNYCSGGEYCSSWQTDISKLEKWIPLLRKALEKIAETYEEENARWKKLLGKEE